MSLLEDMKSGKSRFSNIYEESLLNLIATSDIVNKLADRFLKSYGITRSQFNILMMLKYDGKEGLKQVEISERMIVTASNVSGQIDRLERDLNGEDIFSIWDTEGLWDKFLSEEEENEVEAI